MFDWNYAAWGMKLELGGVEATVFSRQDAYGARVAVLPVPVNARRPAGRWPGAGHKS